MTGITVRFLLVERDTNQAQRVQDAFRAAKIANPMLVVESPRAAASLCCAEANGRALTASVILVGRGLSAKDRTEVLESIDKLSGASTRVVLVGAPPAADEVRAWPVAAPAGHLGVPLTHLAELLDELVLVITTVAGDQRYPLDGEPQRVG